MRKFLWENPLKFSNNESHTKSGCGSAGLTGSWSCRKIAWGVTQFGAWRCKHCQDIQNTHLSVGYLYV